MPLPTYAQLITPSSTAAGLAAESLQERLLTVAAMLASGTGPDGTALPSGGGGSTVLAAGVATSESVNSTAYTDLTTAGPSVTLTVGASGNVLVTLSALISCGTGLIGVLMAPVLSGANTVAAADANGARHEVGNTDVMYELCKQVLMTGLTPGSTTFKAQYRVSGSATGTWSSRVISAIAL